VADRGGAIHGILVTFRRPSALSASLDALALQDQQLERLVVVDNAPSRQTRSIVAQYSAGYAEYLPAPSNGGPAGGVALGMEQLLTTAEDNDWFLLLDDDDPLTPSRAVRKLASFAREMAGKDPKVAGVGLVGARFDWQRGIIQRIADRELSGPVGVDYIGGGQGPLYRAAAIRSVGPFLSKLFFGYDDLEFGLRLRSRGYSLYAHGDLWRREREARGRVGLSIEPSARLGAADWRRYYSLRNHIYLLRAFSRPDLAMRTTAISCLIKPMINLPVAPVGASRHLRLSLKAAWDAWVGNMGRTVDPLVDGDWDRPKEPAISGATGVAGDKG
jgi:glycosyltransferase involved in cell wall biosynthesis